MNHHPFRKRRRKVGAAPGTLDISSTSPPPRITAMHYSVNTFRHETVSDVEELHESFSKNEVTWVDVQGFGDKSMMQQLGTYFGLHRLLLEDVVNVPQRPKAQRYDDQLLLVVRMVRHQPSDEVPKSGLGPLAIDMEQVSMVITANYVLTFQERYGDVLDPVRKRIKAGKGLLRSRGADYLAYAVTDTIIDGYYPVLELVGDRLEALENEVIDNPSPAVLGELHRLKNQLINLRRAIWPQREAINALLRGEHEMLSEEVAIYLRDTYDHCVQTSEVAEMYREMVTGLVNTYLSSIANRTNEVMKVLTIMASIFIPLTFMAGIYGMNFEHIPELKYRYGYPMLWAAMTTTAAGMLVYFRRKGWLGG